MMEVDKMGISLPPWIPNVLNSINQILGYVAPVVNAIVLFMLPMLEPMGNALRNFVLLTLGLVVPGEYVWFIVFTSVIGVGALLLAIFFPGEKREEN